MTGANSTRTSASLDISATTESLAHSLPFTKTQCHYVTLLRHNSHITSLPQQ